jgi:hypothetical protein
VTLVVPGLFGPALTPPQLTLPGLETLLARGDRIDDEREFEALLFDLFDIRAEAGQDLPVAAVTRVLDLGVIDKSWWLRVDPVHLRPDRDRLLLADATMLHLTQEEADQLVAEVMETYAGEGWVLKAARPNRWYLRPPTVPNIKTWPLPVVVGRNIHDYLPQGPDAKRWHTLLNELQILLHTARVNQAREQSGALTINSLWFWGGGRLPELKQVRWTRVWTAEPVSLALARLCEAPSAPVPAGAREWLDIAEAPGEHLIVLDEARSAVQYGDVETWGSFVENLEAEWIIPLLAALRSKTLEYLALYTESARGFTLNVKTRRRWWRRRRRLNSYR